MRNQLTLAIATSAATLLLGACSDASVSESVTGLPSLHSTRGETECVGVLPPGTYHNVVVPEGASCTLNNSVIRGNVKALRNARLTMANDQVHGNVQGDQAFMVWVQASTVEGNIQVKEGQSAGFGGVIGVNISGGTVVKGGNIQIEKMHTDIIFIVNALVEKGNVQLVENVTEVLLQLEFNRVEQNVQVFKNTGPSPKFVSANVVGHQVQCFENTGAFFVGGPNVTPNAQGQCF